MAEAWVGFGGNLGDVRATIAAGIERFCHGKEVRLVARSSDYRTPPWGKTDQAWFFNACAAVGTTLEPEALLDTCLDIERSMKRVRDERWGPRTLDIDVLTYEGVAQAETRLELPHPRMTDRGFVLMPLADIAADMQVRGRTVSDWLRGADVTGIEVADGDMTWWRAKS